MRFGEMSGHVDERPRVIDTSEAPSVFPDRAFDLDQLVRIARGDSGEMSRMLKLFAQQVDILLARMTSEEPRTAAARAHTLAVSARAIGAWKVAEAAAEFERAGSGQGPLMLGPVMNRLSAVVTEAQVEINSLVTR
jgi:HPt (histidine-containing phosphotransfer) domain-containing protein